MHITNNFIKIEIGRNQGKSIEQVKCDQVNTTWKKKICNLIKHEQSLRNDYNEHLSSKWTSKHASN